MKRVLSIITIILFVFSLIKIVIYVYDSFRNKQIINITKDYVIPIRENGYFINFDMLLDMNEDSVGFLIIEGVDIKYPVLKSKDNKYYLNHNFNKEYSGSGSIFMDYRNKADGSDKNIVIYGHNMKDNSMFGKLRNITTKSYRNNNGNLNILLFLGSTLHKYQIFSTYVIDNEDYYTSVNFDSEEDYNLYLNVIKYRSNYNYKVSVNSFDNILTLSTCYSNTNKRVVVHAKEVDL